MIVVRNSQVKLWKKCRQAYWYKEVQGITKRLKALPLRRGSVLHRLLEAHYKKEPWEPLIDAFEENFHKMFVEEQELYGDLPGECRRIMEGYLRQYKGVREKAFAVELEFGEDKPVQLQGDVYLAGRIDLILRDDKGTWLVEHKSHGEIPDESTRFLNLQTVIYLTAAERLGYHLDGVLWNYLRTKTPTVPRLLKDGTISRAKNIDTDYETYLQAIKEAGQDPADYQEELERVSENVFYARKYLPRSDRLAKSLLRDVVITAHEMNKLKYYPHRNLGFHCRSCEYRELCEAELLGLDVEFIRKAEYVSVEEMKRMDKGEFGEYGEEDE